MVSRQQIDEIASMIVEHFSPERIVLFGSYARGDATENSDVDLLVVTRRPGPRGKRSAPIIRFLAERCNAPVDVIVRSPGAVERWADVPGTLVHEITTEGVKLYEKPDAASELQDYATDVRYPSEETTPPTPEEAREAIERAERIRDFVVQHTQSV